MPDLAFEEQHGFFTGKLVCGVDEVGRGPLAGPVVAAAVILPTSVPQILRDGIRDSKALTSRQRESLFEPIRAHCRYAVAESSVAEIDTLNILQASLLAMRRAVEGLGVLPDMALIDGNRCPPLPCPAAAIIKGDARSLSIAAASILAKVTRDRLMTELAAQHPHYGWERNMGDGTAAHLKGLRAHGMTVWHRRSFAPIAALCTEDHSAAPPPHSATRARCA